MTIKPITLKNRTDNDKISKKSTYLEILGAYMKKLSLSFLGLFILLFTLSLLGPTPVQAAPADQNGRWCGSTGEADNYGFTFGLSQPHWTVNGEPFVSADAIDQVDVILDRLNADNIANTMILFINAEDVAVGPTCAGYFLNYMMLGNAEGPRADNGFAFVFNFDKATNKLQVHYSVGGSLNALTSPHLKELKRFGEDTYAQTGSMDTALIETIKAFDEYARQQYEPYYPPTPEPQVIVNQDSNQTFSPLLLVFLCLLALLLFIIVAAALGLFSNSGSSTSDYTPRYTPDSNDGNDTPNYRPSPRPYSPTPSRPSSPPPSRPSTPSRPSSPPPSRSGGGSGKTTRTG